MNTITMIAVFTGVLVFSTSSNPHLSAWLYQSPSFGGSPEQDVRLLGEHVLAGMAMIGVLPPKQDRSQEQLSYAENIHLHCRLLRQRFLDVHASWLYSALTSNRTQYRSLHQLAYDAADLCPGLVPTLAQIDTERRLTQVNKEGYEIDQGLFFHALLSLPTVGVHLIEASLRPTTRALSLFTKFRTESRLDLGTVLIERRDRAAYLTVNNGHNLNAEDNCLVDDMETAIDLALLDDAISVGVLRGGIMKHPKYLGRRVFSAGINLKALSQGQISFVDFLLRREFGYINKIYRGLIHRSHHQEHDVRSSKGVIQKPWIAAVDSFAIGGGAQLLLVFDHILAASDSYLSLPAAQEGIVPGFANLRLHRFLGNRKARQVILCGRKIFAHEPDANLIIDEVVDPLDLDAAIKRSVQHFQNPAVVANRQMLNLSEEPIELFLRYGAEFALLQAERIYSSDVLDKIRRV